jgi:hypothetical protein
MEKENVLEIEYQEVFDSVVFRIKYQNDEILKRGKFADWDIRVISNDNESVGYHNIHDFLNIRNNYTRADTRNFLVTKTEFKSIKERVDKLNEKYGIPKRWRGERSDKYFSIFGDNEISETTDNYFPEDQRRYELGNYFKTLEEAEKIKGELDKFWAKVRAGEIGND